MPPIKYDVDVSVFGDQGSGVSALCHRAVFEKFDTNLATTTKPRSDLQLRFDQQGVRVSITDLPHFSVENSAVLAKELESAMAVFICKDVSEEKAGDWSDAETLFRFASEQVQPHCIMFLVLTKADACANLAAAKSRAHAFVQAHQPQQVVSHFVTSAKTGEGIVEGAETLAQMVVMRAQSRGE